MNKKYEPLESYMHTSEVTHKSTSNGCLMRITPLAVWGCRLSPSDLYEAVLYQTALTHTNPIAIEGCFLYCYAIGRLITHGDRIRAWEETLLMARRETM